MSRGVFDRRNADAAIPFISTSLQEPSATANYNSALMSATQSAADSLPQSMKDLNIKESTPQATLTPNWDLVCPLTRAPVCSNPHLAVGTTGVRGPDI
jgi:hypothetical protein